MLVSMQLAQIFLTAAVAVATVSGSAIATAAPLYTVSQGDEILIGAPGYFPSHSCTLGFNGDGYSYTAAHCGDTGDLVYIEDSNGLLKGPLGTVTNSPLYSGFDDDQEPTMTGPGSIGTTQCDWERIAFPVTPLFPSPNFNWVKQCAYTETLLNEKIVATLRVVQRRLSS